MSAWLALFARRRVPGSREFGGRINLLASMCRVKPTGRNRFEPLRLAQTPRKPCFALAQLGVARANALEARTSHGADVDAARSRGLAAYKDFLTLWKDADPDIPILKQAKAEYARFH